MYIHFKQVMANCYTTFCSISIFHCGCFLGDNSQRKYLANASNTSVFQIHPCSPATFSSAHNLQWSLHSLCSHAAPLASFTYNTCPTMSWGIDSPRVVSAFQGTASFLAEGGLCVGQTGVALGYRQPMGFKTGFPSWFTEHREEKQANLVKCLFQPLESKRCGMNHSKPLHDPSTWPKPYRRWEEQDSSEDLANLRNHPFVYFIIYPLFWTLFLSLHTHTHTHGPSSGQNKKWFIAAVPNLSWTRDQFRGRKLSTDLGEVGKQEVELRR